MRVFISSTNEDLREYRAAARDAINAAGAVPDMQEYWGADGNPPLEVCLNKAATADLVVAIVAHRYGWVPVDQPAGDRKSITWLECEAAKANGKEVLAYIVDEKCAWDLNSRDSYALAKALEDGAPELEEAMKDNVRRLKAFKTRLCAEVIRETFTSVEDLKCKVQIEVAKRLAAHGAGDRARAEAHDREVIRGVRPGAVSELFRDRVDQLQQLKRLLLDEGAVFVCIVGRGGIGKTALLSKLCSQIESGDLRLTPSAVQRGADGKLGVDGLIYWSFRGGNPLSLDQLFFEFGQMLGGPHAEELLQCSSDASRSEEGKIQFLLSKLRHGRYLLVLDNMEDALADRTIVDDGLRTFLTVCLRTSHGLKILATSRRRVDVSGDPRLHRVVQLEVGLPEADGVSLLKDLDPDDQCGLRSASDALLGEVVRRCYGIPRALEIIRQIKERKPRLKLQEFLKDTRVFNESVLENLIADNYSAMTDDHRRIVEALAVYNRPVPAEAVAAIVDHFHPQVDVEASLDHLIPNNTIYMRQHGVYDLHPADQEYHYHKIPDSNQGYSKPGCHRQAAAFYRAQRKPLEEWQDLDDLDEVLSEFNHLALAGDYRSAHEVLFEIDWSHLRPWGHYGKMIDLHERLKGMLDPDQEINRLNMLAVAYAKVGRILTSIERLEEALPLARQTSATFDDAMLFNNLTTRYLRIGDIDRARTCSAETFALLAVPGESGERQVAIDANAESAFRNWGDCLAAIGDAPRARESLQRALFVAARLAKGEQARRTCQCLERLGQVALDENEPGRARDTFQQALQIADQLRFLELQHLARQGLAQAHLLAGDFQQACTAVQEAPQTEIPDSAFFGAALYGLIALGCGDSATAADKFQTAIAKADGILTHCKEVHAALDTKGIALCGLALCQDPSHAAQAARVFAQARSVCCNAGIVARVERLLRTFDALDGDNLLQEARRAATHPCRSPAETPAADFELPSIRIPRG